MNFICSQFYRLTLIVITMFYFVGRFYICRKGTPKLIDRNARSIISPVFFGDASLNSSQHH